MARRSLTILVKVIVLAVSLFAGLLCPYAAFAMTGGGHGWLAPMYVSWLAILAAPLASASHFAECKTLRSDLAGTLLGVAVVSDCILGCLTLNEGIEYFQKLWYAHPSTPLVWASSWAYWQALALSSWVRGLFWTAAR